MARSRLTRRLSGPTPLSPAATVALRYLRSVVGAVPVAVVVQGTGLGVVEVYPALEMLERRGLVATATRPGGVETVRARQ